MTILDVEPVQTVARRPRRVPLPDGDNVRADLAANELLGLDDIEQRCWAAFLESSTLLLEKLNRSLIEAHELTLLDFLALDLLARSRDGSVRMGDLADALAVGPSRVTHEIRRLEAESLVNRSRSTKDRRGVIARITPHGRLRLRSAARTYGAHVRECYFDRMTRPQMIAMADSCRRINHPLRQSRRSERLQLV